MADDYSDWTLEPAKPAADPYAAWKIVPAESVSKPHTSGLEAVGAGIADIIPGERQAAAALSTAIRKGRGMQGSELPWGELYRQVGYNMDHDLHQAHVEHPGLTNVGRGLGVGASLAFPLFRAGGAGLAGMAIRGAVNLGGYGALNGALNSKGELTKGEFGQVAADALRTGLPSAILGTLLGPAAELAAPYVASAASKVLSPLAGALEAMGINAGRRVLLNGVDQLSNRAKVPDEAVLEAIDSKAIRPWSTTEKAHERLQHLSSAQEQLYSSIVSNLESNGIHGPKAAELADTLVNRAAELEPNTMNDALPAKYLEQAEKVIGKAGNSETLGLEQSENLKRSLQDMARYGKREETEINGVNRDIASVFRQANEDAIDHQLANRPADVELQKLGAQFVPVKQRLGRLLEAENAAERGAARGSQRGHFSLTDQMFGHSVLAARMAHGDPTAIAKGFAAMMGKNYLRTRGGSAGATYAVGLANALRGLADSSESVLPSLLPAAGDVTANELKAIEQFFGPPAIAEDDQGKSKALAQALRGNTP